MNILKKKIYNIKLSKDMKYQGMMIIISEKYLNSFIDDQEIIRCFNLMENNNIFKYKIIRNCPKRLIYIVKFILYYNNYLGRKLFTLGKINEIVGGVITVFIRNSLNLSKEKDVYEMIKEYIDENYSDPKILDKIHKKFYFNRLELSKEFRRKTGFGVYEYLKNIKLEESYYLLISQKMKVHEVAELLGYSSYGYFSKIFKDYFGVSPKNVQKTFKYKKI